MPWHTLYHFQFNQKLAKIVNRYRLLIYLIHATFESSLDIFVFYVSSNGYNCWLSVFSDVHARIQFSNLLCCLITIHKWHIAIHQDQTISERIALKNCAFDRVQRFFSIIGKLCFFFTIFDTQYHQEPIYDILIKLFIIHDQYLPRIVYKVAGTRRWFAFWSYAPTTSWYRAHHACLPVDFELLLSQIWVRYIFFSRELIPQLLKWVIRWLFCIGLQYWNAHIVDHVNLRTFFGLLLFR